MAGYDNGAVAKRVTEKTLDLVIQASKLTPDTLKEAMNVYLNRQGKKKGQVSIAALAAESGSKLDSIEITDSNIKDFQKIADKHHIKYAMKRDSGVDPPVYHVFFQTANADNFQKAFAEYAGAMKDKVQQKEYVLPREKQQELAADLHKAQSREKLRKKNRGDISL